MCRNIRPLFNFVPPATDDEISAAAMQFVRKISGFTSPSVKNQAAFDRAVAEISDASATLRLRWKPLPNPVTVDGSTAGEGRSLRGLARRRRTSAG